jgi:hypothetical protein
LETLTELKGEYSDLNSKIRVIENQKGELLSLLTQKDSYQKFKEYQKKTVTAVVTDFLEASIPAAEAMLTAFQELEKGVDQTEILKNLLATGLEGAAKNLRD